MPALVKYKKRVAAGTFSHSLQFSHDSTLFFASLGSQLRAYSTETGLFVRAFECNAGKIVDTKLNSFNGKQIYVAYADGTVCCWDYTIGVLLHSWQTGVKIHSIAPLKEALYLVSELEKYEKTNGAESTRSRVYKYSLETASLEIIHTAKSVQILDIIIAKSSLFFGTGRIFGRLDLETQETFKYELRNRITAIAYYQEKNMLALGDELGKIFLIYADSFAKGKTPFITDMHWHAHQVNTLAFSLDGGYLLSGGEESVLVAWQLGTGHKQFLPRMGAPIKTIVISPDQKVYAVGQVDNSVRIVSASSMDTKHMICGVHSAHLDPTSYPRTFGLMYDIIGGSFVVNGHPGDLQFYQPLSERTVLQVHVSQRNRVSRIEDKEIHHLHVSRAHFSGDGEWLATVAAREDDEFGNEFYLNFWKYSFDIKDYELNTVVDFPHSKSITSVIIGPKRSDMPLLAVTTSKDAKFKLWQLKKPQNPTEAGILTNVESWICRAESGYKNLSAECAAFSEDGSLLAVAFNSVIILWDPITMSVVGKFTVTGSRHAVKSMHFTKSEPYLVVSTGSKLDVWNVLAGAVQWSLAVEVDHIAADHGSPKFAVTRKEGSRHCMHVFEPSSPQPMFTGEFSGPAIGVTFTKEPSGASSVVVLDCEHSFSYWSTDARDQENVHDYKLGKGVRESVFSAIYGQALRETNRMDVDGETETSRDKIELSKRKEAKMLAFLNAPSHIVAPPSRLIASFMRDMLRPLEEVSQAEQEVDNEETSEASAEASLNDAGVDQEVPETDALESWLCGFVQNMTWDDKLRENGTSEAKSTISSAKKQLKKTEKLSRKSNSSRKTPSRAGNGSRS